MAAPVGNQYARGNRGGGAPRGNRNAWKHGGYARIYWDSLSEEEWELLAGMNGDNDALIRDEIAMLLIRQRRLMHIINYLLARETIEWMTVEDRWEGVQTYRLVAVEKSTTDIAMRFGDQLTRCTRLIAAYALMLEPHRSSSVAPVNNLLEALAGIAE